MDLEAIRQAFKEDHIFWPFFIARPLEEIRKGLALEWVIRCVTRLLPDSGSPHLAQLQIDLDLLTAWAHDLPTSIPYRPERGREIWDYPGRECGGAHRGMSNLYAAYHHYKKDDRSYVQDCGTPIQNFFWDTHWNQRPDDLFQLVIEVSQELRAECGAPPL